MKGMDTAVAFDDVATLTNAWPHRLAVFTTATTFLLILAGGVVTSTGTGMAVPDWPTTFGYNMFLYPWSKMVGGIFYEHAHRLLGSFVGSLTLTLVVLLWALEPRVWVRAVGLGALGAVIIQGVLGGLRVVLAAPILAIVHGGFAHAVFALMGGIALVTSAGWQTPVSFACSADDRRLRRLALWTSVGLYAQVLAGTLVTHLGVRLDAHIFMAALISVAVVWLGFRIAPRRAEWPELARPETILRALWILQLTLGAGAYVARFHPGVMTSGPGMGLPLAVGHRLVAAVMLLTSVVLTLRIYRRTSRLDPAPSHEITSSTVTA